MRWEELHFLLCALSCVSAVIQTRYYLVLVSDLGDDGSASPNDLGVVAGVYSHLQSEAAQFAVFLLLFQLGDSLIHGHTGTRYVLWRTWGIVGLLLDFNL